MPARLDRPPSAAPGRPAPAPGRPAPAPGPPVAAPGPPSAAPGPPPAAPGPPRPARVPRTIHTATRTEVTGAPLRLLEGTLPSDLRGHVFVVGAVGSFSSNALPRTVHQTTTTLNGDGMVYRFDLGGGGVAVTTRLVRTDDFRLDAALGPDEPRFSDYGFVRFARHLGTRNQANTAFQPLPPATPNGPPRLLLTWDAGRPVEIDTASLEVATLVGRREEWTPEAAAFLPLAPTFSAAHPAFDPQTGELFTANFGKGFAGLLGSAPGFNALRRATRAHLRDRADGRSVHRARAALLDAPVAIGNALRRRSRIVRHLVPSRFTVLLRWRGEGDLDAFLLKDAQTGRRVGVAQSMHTVAVTDHYVVLLDSAFEIGAASLIHNYFPDGTIAEWARRRRGSLPDRAIDLVERALRRAVTAPNLPSAAAYLVPRAALAAADRWSAAKPGEWRVVDAVRVDLPGPVVHFLADPDDAAGTRVVLHVVHQSCTDVALWLANFDRLLDGGAPPLDLLGLLPAPMDLSRLARYEIDPRTGQILLRRELVQDPEFWEIALLAGPGVGLPGPTPRRHRFAIYYAIGFWSELATQFAFNLYRDDPQRVVAPSVVRGAVAAEGRPTQLFRVDLESLLVVDSYALTQTDDSPAGPVGRMLGSPQYVPRAGADPELLDGYLTVLSYRLGGVDLLVFDARSLASGPLCRLELPADVDPGFLLHSAWLDRVGPRDAPYRVDTRQDYAHVLSPGGQPFGPLGERILQRARVRSLFDAHVHRG